MSRLPGFTFYLNVEIGEHVTHAELLAHHHAVLYAVGAPNDRRLDIEGMGLPGSGTATEMVAWINGHPDFADLPVDLSHERVVDRRQRQRRTRRGAGADHRPDDLARTDVADHALAALRESQRAGGGHRGAAWARGVGVHAARVDRADREPATWCSTPVDHELVRDGISQRCRMP